MFRKSSFKFADFRNMNKQKMVSVQCSIAKSKILRYRFWCKFMIALERLTLHVFLVPNETVIMSTHFYFSNQQNSCADYKRRERLRPINYCEGSKSYLHNSGLHEKIEKITNYQSNEQLIWRDMRGDAGVVILKLIVLADLMKYPADSHLSIAYW